MSDPGLFATLLELPLISRIRRNHGLEHATLHVLAERNPKRSLAGYSDPGGFWLMGELQVEEVQSALEIALQRLRSGEHGLAIHQNCGTNVLVAGLFSGLAAGLGLLGTGRRWRNKLERIPFILILATLAVMVAKPVGLLLQERVTTSGWLGGLQVRGIYLNQLGRVYICRVVTAG